MIDLHSHLLFDIDDGAREIEDSVEILKKARKIGIEKIMITPHFSIGDDVEDFISKRDERLSELKEAMKKEEIDIEIKAGAEVYITDELFNETELHRLTMGDSKFILAEFKYHNVRGEDFLEYIDEMLSGGFKILVAHVERYSFVRKSPVLLDALINRGVLLQVNAISLLEDGPEGDFARWLVKNRLVYAVASDIHHVPSRRYEAMEKLNDGESEYMERLLNANPDKIFENTLQRS